MTFSVGKGVKKEGCSDFTTIARYLKVMNMLPFETVFSLTESFHKDQSVNEKTAKYICHLSIPKFAKSEQKNLFSAMMPVDLCDSLVPSAY